MHIILFLLRSRTNKRIKGMQNYKGNNNSYPSVFSAVLAGALSANYSVAECAPASVVETAVEVVKTSVEVATTSPDAVTSNVGGLIIYLPILLALPLIVYFSNRIL
jgi:hypothetical protein